VVVFGDGVRVELVTSGQLLQGEYSNSTDGGVDGARNSDGGSSSTGEGESSTGGGTRQGTSDAGRSTTRQGRRVAGGGGNHAATSLAQLSLPGSQCAIYGACRDRGGQQQGTGGQEQQLQGSQARGGVLDGQGGLQQQHQQHQQQEQEHKQQPPAGLEQHAVNSGQQGGVQEELLAVVTNSRCLIYVPHNRWVPTDLACFPARMQQGAAM